MAKFRVLSGLHYEGDTCYEQGSIVETDRDLVAAFGMEKFAEIEDSTDVETQQEETPEPESKSESKPEKKKVNLKRKS